MDTVKIGHFLSALRKEAGLTQEELGEQLGVTNKTVSRWETGTYMPDIEMLSILSEKYGVTLNELLSGEHLEDDRLRKEADDNIKTVYKQNKKTLKKYLFGAAAVCLTFCILFGVLLFAVDYENLKGSQKSRLFPVGTSDERDSKLVMDDISVSYREPEKAEEYITDDGMRITFELPDGYYAVPDSAQFPMWLKENGENVYLMINHIDMSEWKPPFIENGLICRADYVKYAFAFDLSQVSVRSSNYDIDRAAAVRTMRAKMGIVNDPDSVGEFYRLTGDVNGYLINSGAADGTQRRFWICHLECGSYDLSIAFYPPAEDCVLEKVIDTISTFSVEILEQRK